LGLVFPGDEHFPVQGPLQGQNEDFGMIFEDSPVAPGNDGEDDEDASAGFFSFVATEDESCFGSDENEGDDDEGVAPPGEGGSGSAQYFDLGPRTKSMAEEYALTRRALAKKAVLLQQQQQQRQNAEEGQKKDGATPTSSSSSAAVSAEAPASNVSLRMPHLSNMLFREAERTESEHKLPSLIDGTDPSIVTFMRQILTCLPTETVPAHLNPDGVRSARKALRVSRREHEESMMRTPLANEPACSNGPSCVGTRIAGGSGAVLVAYKFEGDSEPVPDGLCILCMRKVIYGNIISLRAENRCMRPMQVLMCTFYNLVNVPGEYRAVDCIGPAEHVFEGIVMPVVKLDLSSFHRVPDPAMQVTRFRQLLPRVAGPVKPFPQQLSEAAAALEKGGEGEGNF